MQPIRIVLALTLLAAVAGAQSAPPDKIVATSSEIMAMVAKAKAERKADQPTFAQPLLALAPYGANLEYRAAIGPSAVHKKYAEFFYVVDGSATLVTGGKLVNEKSNGDNLSGTGIEGGSPRQVAKGDFVIVPEGTPHWFSTINGNITLMSFRLPRP
jgi:mannose-6-phosphate isomerase-like protein (cupin superfamily)